MSRIETAVFGKEFQFRVSCCLYVSSCFGIDARGVDMGHRADFVKERIGVRSYERF